MEIIRQLRLAKGLTQEELAKMVDVTGSQISQIESGKRKPSFETLLKLGEALDCSSAYLLMGEKNPVTVIDDENVNDDISTIKECNDIMRTLPPEKQKLALNLLKTLASSQ